MSRGASIVLRPQNGVSDVWALTSEAGSAIVVSGQLTFHSGANIDGDLLCQKASDVILSSATVLFKGTIKGYGTFTLMNEAEAILSVASEAEFTHEVRVMNESAIRVLSGASVELNGNLNCDEKSEFLNDGDLAVRGSCFFDGEYGGIGNLMVDSKSIVAFGGDVFTRGSVVVANLAKVSISSTDASFLGSFDNSGDVTLSATSAVLFGCPSQVGTGIDYSFVNEGFFGVKGVANFKCEAYVSGTTVVDGAVVVQATGIVEIVSDMTVSASGALTLVVRSSSTK